jgi:hypothetical protein
MAMSLSIGYLAGRLTSALRDVKANVRSRILWLASPAASPLLLTAAAVAVMGIAVVTTTSRSGLIALFASTLLLAVWMTARQPSKARKVVTAGYVAALLTVAASWGQIDRVLTRFERAPEDPRLQIWQDTLQVIHDFPLTGTGLNTYGIAMLHYQQKADFGTRNIEAHNDYLQLAAEGGLLLGIPALIVLLLFVREVWRRFREREDDASTYWLRVGAVTGMIAVAIQEVTDFTLQMPGAAVLFVVLAAIAIHKPDSRRAGIPPIELAVIVIGLIVSAIAGVVAYRIVGIYGDGPFTYGMHRTTDADTGESVIVQDVSGPDGRAKRRIIEGTKVTGLQLDVGDKGLATVQLGNKDLTRIDRDVNGDGRVDAWEYYDRKQQLVKTGFSLRNDGVLDAWLFRNAQGQTTKIEVATRRDGTVSRWEYYENGQLARTEEDADGNGKIDRWQTYDSGILWDTKVDKNGDGRPD